MLWQVYGKWRRQIDGALHEIGLTHPQFILLTSTAWLTKDGDLVTQAELARHCTTDITMTSQVLRVLEKKGLIERIQIEGNEKSKFPQVTAKGAKLVEKAIPVVEEIDDAFFEILGRQTSSCVSIFQKLSQSES